MLLLITGSIDGTADRIVQTVPNVFRLNYDLWRDYRISYTPGYWSIESPTGLMITSETASGAFWWKAYSYTTGDDRFIKEEVKYFLRDLYGWFRSRGLAKGNSPDFHNLYGKINLLGVASKFFKIPQTRFCVGATDSEESFFESNLVAKSLASMPTSDGKVMLTERIDSADQLDFKFPWFLQHEIESEWDATVFLCGTKFFPFRRSRKELAGIDWRAEQDFTLAKQEWFPFDLTKTQERSLTTLSEELCIEFGRYDFMIEPGSGELVFLELNATGQWVFLDVENKYGLLDQVSKWLQSESLS